MFLFGNEANEAANEAAPSRTRYCTLASKCRLCLILCNVPTYIRAMASTLVAMASYALAMASYLLEAKGGGES